MCWSILHPMNNQEQSTAAWTAAERDCWTVVTKATAVQKLVNALRDIPVVAVLPLCSTTCPSLIITPLDPEDKDALVSLCDLIKVALDLPTSEHWTSHPQGPYWCLRLRYSGINIDLATQVAVSQPTEFKVS